MGRRAKHLTIAERHASHLASDQTQRCGAILCISEFFLDLLCLFLELAHDAKPIDIQNTGRHMAIRARQLQTLRKRHPFPLKTPF
jgi:hypothetical protein